MSGQKINNYSQTDSNILELMLTSDQVFKGKHNVSLTNYDNTSVPQIAAGSVIEVNGALYKFTANETITGSPSDGTVYIMVVPSTTTCTAVYTNTAPTWSDDKQGWYGTSTTAGYRYIEYFFILSSSTWGKIKGGYSSKNFHPISVTAVGGVTNITSTGDTALIVDSEVSDYNNLYNTSNYTFTTNESGMYFVIFEGMAVSIGSGYLSLKLYKNGSSFIESIGFYAVSGVQGYLNCSNSIILKAGDYLKLYAYSSADNSMSVTYPKMSIYKIG